MISDDPNTIPRYFITTCRTAINTMRHAGINEVLIACVIQDIRSATLNEEFGRLQEIVRTNPPTHHPHGTMAEAINQWSVT
jgi:hypothetical protein